MEGRRLEYIPLIMNTGSWNVTPYSLKTVLTICRKLLPAFTYVFDMSVNFYMTKRRLDTDNLLHGGRYENMISCMAFHCSISTNYLS